MIQVLKQGAKLLCVSVCLLSATSPDFFTAIHPPHVLGLSLLSSPPDCSTRPHTCSMSPPVSPNYICQFTCFAPCPSVIMWFSALVFCLSLTLKSAACWPFACLWDFGFLPALHWLDCLCTSVYIIKSLNCTWFAWWTCYELCWATMLGWSLSTYHILSVGGGGMLTTRVPDSSWTSTVSSRGVLDISSNFFLMNSFSVAFWKYLDLAILSTNLKIFLPVFPPPVLWERIRGEEFWIGEQI